MKIRQKISDELKKHDLPEPTYPGKDRDLLKRFDRITDMGDKELHEYFVKVTAFLNYYTYQAVQKKHEIHELEHDYDKALYIELENVDAKEYKTIKERVHKALQRNSALDELSEELLLQREKSRDLEGLEKVFENTVKTVGREVSRRKELIRGRDVFNADS